MSLRTRLLDSRYRRDARAGHPRGTALRPESHERDQRRAGQPVGNRQRYFERPERQDPGHGPAPLRPRPRPRPRHTRQGGLLRLPVGGARGIPAVHRHLDHQSGRQPVLQFAANQPNPRSQGSRVFQAGHDCDRRRHARARVRPADRDIRVADRIPGARGIRRAQIRPARLVQSQEIRRGSREALAERKPDPAGGPQGHGAGCAPGKRLGRAAAHRLRIRSCFGLRRRRAASRSAR